MDMALLSQDVSTHIALIKDKQISAQELAELQYRYIQRVNPKINAFYKLLYLIVHLKRRAQVRCFKAFV